jgi:hypothetical protein
VRKTLRWTEASISCSYPSTTVTYEHAYFASSSIHLQLIGWDEEPGGPSKYDPDTPELMVLKDPGARAASPRPALPETPMPGTFSTDAPTGHRRAPGSDGVRLLLSWHSFFQFGIITVGVQHHMHTRRTPAGKTKGGPS